MWRENVCLIIGYEAFATGSTTPPSHLLFLQSQETVPKLVVRRTLAFNEVNLSHFFESASISAAEGKVFPTTPDLGFCTCDSKSAFVLNGPNIKHQLTSIKNCKLGFATTSTCSSCLQTSSAFNNSFL